MTSVCEVIAGEIKERGKTKGTLGVRSQHLRRDKERGKTKGTLVFVHNTYGEIKNREKQKECWCLFTALYPPRRCPGQDFEHEWLRS